MKANIISTTFVQMQKKCGQTIDNPGNTEQKISKNGRGPSRDGRIKQYGETRKTSLKVAPTTTAQRNRQNQKIAAVVIYSLLET